MPIHHKIRAETEGEDQAEGHLPLVSFFKWLVALSFPGAGVHVS